MSLPVVLGGPPIRRPGTVRTTPELGDLEVDYLAAWALSPDNLEDLLHLGRPLAEGLELDPVVAEVGREAAAFGAELGAVHAPGLDAVVIPVTNGTHSLTLAIRSLALHADRLGLRPHRPGASVIVPGLTWPATAIAPLLGRYVPRIADVDPTTLTIDPASVAALIDDTTVAIYIVDLYCSMADRDAILALAARYGLAVIEDCAHSHGAAWRDLPAGLHGHVGSFSLQGSKTLSAGDMGAVITRDRRLADQIVSIAHCGRQVGSSLPAMGANDRAAGIVCALARAQAQRFPGQNALRLQTFAALDDIAAGLPGVIPMRTQPQVTRRPTYKWAARYDVGQTFAPLSLRQLATALAADLSCEVTTTYEPLVASAVYQPGTDPMIRYSDEWSRIDPARYDTPHAREAHRTVLCIEHAAGLDPSFASAFAESIERIRRHAAAIARALA